MPGTIWIRGTVFAYQQHRQENIFWHGDGHGWGGEGIDLIYLLNIFELWSQWFPTNVEFILFAKFNIISLYENKDV